MNLVTELLPRPLRALALPRSGTWGLPPEPLVRDGSKRQAQPPVRSDSHPCSHVGGQRQTVANSSAQGDELDLLRRKPVDVHGRADRDS